MLMGDSLLSIFGPEFTGGRTSLMILALAQLFNVAAGSAGVALTMTGHERDAAVAIGIGSTMNIILNWLLIPVYAVNGAAMATAASMILWNTLLVLSVRRRMNISTTVFGLLARRRRRRT
jgi:O-antigen/teichoic acid export membrane protein